MSESNALLTRLATLTALEGKERKDLARRELELQVLQEDIDQGLRGVELCQRCLDEQADMKAFMEAINTALLRAVMGEELSYVLEPVMDDRGVSTIGLKPMIAEDGVALPPKQFGGGVRSVASLGNRMCFNAFLSKRIGTMPFMVLDEQLMHLDEDRWPRLLQFIQDFQRDIPFQFIFITHAPGDYPRTITFHKSGRSTSKIQQVGATLHGKWDAKAGVWCVCGGGETP